MEKSLAAARGLSMGMGWVVRQMGVPQKDIMQDPRDGTVPILTHQYPGCDTVLAPSKMLLLEKSG